MKYLLKLQLVYLNTAFSKEKAVNEHLRHFRLLSIEETVFHRS